ncbi:hypothetical protein [Cylindrospermopsis raciborskii]|uniref:Lipoprotein n=1 Tax=Cylindrospermopsis raciborskii CENA302 TaxID=1170768 RepID=A0A9Q5QUK8_9CYAN|nr:hypothetical protein [Cylindrospermopsis raciborskii]NLQ04893.1 hypothetical protein [Cylindrospermopsis raciborskii MVCC19]OHY33588.1 hypothetical protein BCV64_08500 [Cylindrospermopsis raciborskii MVCC14]OPH08539.1 hypothetical protein CENA302_15890 [Cylindrospermopsis raciborskii CENA302]
MARLLFGGILTLLVLSITACSSLVLIPTYELVVKAVSMQIEQAQEELEQKLDLDFEGFTVEHLVINQQQALTIENLPGYHLEGVYDLKVKLPTRQITQLHNHFNIYLQIQKEGKSWRLLIPEKSGEKQPLVWRGYLII